MVISKLERDGLIAGNFPLVTIAVATSNSVKRGEVISINDEFKVVAVDANNPVRGIVADDVETDSETTVNVYIKGEFAERHLIFPEGNTIDNHRTRMLEIGLITRQTTHL